MKSKIGTNDEKKHRHTVQLFSDPSPINARRAAPNKPMAQAAAATPVGSAIKFAIGALHDWGIRSDAIVGDAAEVVDDLQHAIPGKLKHSAVVKFPTADRRAIRQQPLDISGVLHDRIDRLVELGDDIGRRTGRREDDREALNAIAGQGLGDRLDILVLNAGVSKTATIEDTTVEDFDHLFAVNVRAPFFLVQQLLPILRNGSNVVLLSSLGARAAVGTLLSAYSASKGAVEALVKPFAAALGPRGIRVNAVAPGVTDTEMSNFSSDFLNIVKRHFFK